MTAYSRVFIAVLIALIGTGLLYLAGAFVAGTFDSTAWDSSAKAMMLFPWALILGVSCVVAADGRMP